MAYSSGMLDERVTVLRPVSGEGRGSRTRWEELVTVWAGVTWTKGSRGLMQGEVTDYDVILVRMRWRDDVTKFCRIRRGGRVYAIESLNGSRRENTIQMTCREVKGE